ncbi:hypothetical protein C8R44DRAFT_887073 [Mycena epipterygia]|nr:hypothetical protein C8R44DRAFT_887073 [Mycena epipterygia]
MKIVEQKQEVRFNGKVLDDYEQIEGDLSALRSNSKTLGAQVAELHSDLTTVKAALLEAAQECTMVNTMMMEALKLLNNAHIDFAATFTTSGPRGPAATDKELKVNTKQPRVAAPIQDLLRKRGKMWKQ